MSEAKFNPAEHLMQLSRKQRQLDGSYQQVVVDYLEVKYRIIWFRETHPDGVITTEMLSQPGSSPAVMRATITLPNGVTATGFGQVSQDSFSDYVEKAETRSIGRALALLGFGTQFCEEFEGIIADAPVDRDGDVDGEYVDDDGVIHETPAQNAPRTRQDAPERTQEPQQESGATTAQINYLKGLAKGVGWERDELNAECKRRFNVASFENLDRHQASTLIEDLKKRPKK